MALRTLLCIFAFCTGTAFAAPPPAQDFFDNPTFSGALLSPSGKYLAARVAGPEGRDRLAVVDLATLDAKVVAAFRDGDIGGFQWISDSRLLFDSTDRDLAPGQVRSAPGLFAVDRDGSHYRQLAQRNAAFVRSPDVVDLLPWHTYMLHQPGAQDGEWVYVQSADFEAAGSVRALHLLKLNTRTGMSLEVSEPGDVQHWLLDEKGEPRVAVTLEKGQNTVWLLDGGKWRALGSFAAYGAGVGGFEPLMLTGDGKLYVSTRGNGDKAAVYEMDTATGKLAPRALFALQRHDFHGWLIQQKGKLAGIRFTGDSDDTAWFDADAKAVQDAVDAKLPGLVNLVDLPRRPETPYALVKTYSDRQPAIYFIYDRTTGKFRQVGKSRPRIDPRQMGTQENVTFKARDGLEIPALLTLPPGATAHDRLPMVVLVHGGPWVRGTEWGWRPDSQFLASRGYAVLEPEFRGSTGYGERLFKAGLKQWGLAMQDDIADATRWAIAQGTADPKRICIAGASYGGYATLMGLIRDPDLYRCGVEWAGVTDIKLMYGTWFHSSDVPSQYIKYGMPQLIGDLEKDAAQLTATSPVEQAVKLRQPLLMAYGTADHRVPLEHGKRMRDAIRATNRNVEWVEYEDEGHGWSLPKNRIDFWNRVDAFLARNLAKEAP